MQLTQSPILQEAQSVAVSANSEDNNSSRGFLQQTSYLPSTLAAASPWTLSSDSPLFDAPLSVTSSFAPFHKDERAKDDLNKSNALRSILKRERYGGMKRRLNEGITNEVKKVRCNCKKTSCLKMYCDCFKLKGYCEDCNCTACMNTPQFEENRVKAMEAIKLRNPLAFKRVLTSKTTGECTPGSNIAFQSMRGCHCKRSNCSKKYCECFQMGTACGAGCECINCFNV
eukprot:TRINITY_DN1842_c0_g3_i1.p1 TRINITY_DN1842_c0_g3~~TRINITY_DN1842_c0_g3_i1.p1  ORF type:complete len:228 (-),score=22.78 TRINITY_DN1842_c0_g3_i1:159-842(-)